jgi:AcrR family transcriptional regulator
MSSEFTERLRQAFEFATMAEIARRIGVPHATVRNYFHGRLPAPDVLIKIANETNVSLNWLLTGAGEMYVSGAAADIGHLIEQCIDAMIDRKIAARAEDEVQNLGNIDARPPFDIEAAVRGHGDPETIMNEWFRYEGRNYPSDYGVVFFKGWEGYSDSEKADALRDAKRVLDRTLRKRKQP